MKLLNLPRIDNFKSLIYLQNNLKRLRIGQHSINININQIFEQSISIKYLLLLQDHACP